MTNVQEPTEAPLIRTWRNAPTRTLNAGDVEFVYRQLGPSTGMPVVLLTHLNCLNSVKQRTMSAIEV